MQQPKPPPRGVEAVNRALKLLAAFDSQHRELPLADLARRTGLYKSTILRLAESLELGGYLQRNSQGQYKVGPQPVRLAALFRIDLHPAEVVMPVLRRLSAATSESAALYVRAGDRRLCAYRSPSPRATLDNVQQGELLPLERGAGGHVLLAFCGARGERYDQIRSRKLAVTLGERDSETAAVACPVFGPGGHLEGALSISGPLHRFTPAATTGFCEQLVAGARDLTLQLGGDPQQLAAAGSDPLESHR